MLNHHGEVMEILGTKAAAVAYSGAATTLGSGALVIFGLPVSQVQIAFLSMLIGAIVGIGGLIASVIFKWLAHKESCRVNRVNEAVRELHARKNSTN